MNGIIHNSEAGNILLENIWIKMKFLVNIPPSLPKLLVSSCLTPAGALTLLGKYLRYPKPAVLLCSQFNLRASIS